MRLSDSSSWTFVLSAFDCTASTEQIFVNVKLQGSSLQLVYFLPVSLPGVLSDRRVTQFQRKDELWKSNCLELFVGSDSSSGYWEFNFSFNGDWNCYRFDSYRAGMREEVTVNLYAFKRENVEENIEFHISTRLPDTLNSQPALCPTAVIIDPTSKKPHFFAPSHPADKPDFHLSENRVSID